jgi:mRNA interferase RelE/StbE
LSARYQILVTPKAQKEIDDLDSKLRRQVMAKLEALESNPRPSGCVKLAGQESLWRVRVREYRILYEIQDKKLFVLVVRVDHRSEVYR